MQQKNSYGFSALGLIGAVLLGSTLSLGYVNLSHYLIASSALEQASRTAVRCVSPTNAECSALVQPSAKPMWRYLATTLSPKGDLYSEEYDYSAKLFRQRFVAETPYYSIAQENAPKVKITTYNLPTARFREIQAYKNINLVFEYQGEIERNVAVPSANPFPVFDPGFEKDHENYSFSRRIADASPSQREVLEGFQVVFTAPFSQNISGTESESFNGDLIRQINLGKAPFVSLSSLLKDEGQTEGCALGRSCGVRELAGGVGRSQSDDYKDFRYLAFYLEVEVTSRSPNALLGIKGVGGRSGFNLDIAEAKTDNQICLGGRELTRLSNLDGRFFNLWLRGAAGSTGGSNSFRDRSCPGDYRLSNIRLDKEGKFRPTIGLVLGGQKGDRIAGKVTLRAFVDTYQKQVESQTITKTCDPVSLKRGVMISQVAPSPRICGLSGNEKNITRKIISANEGVVGCMASSEDLALFPVSTELPQQLLESLSVGQQETVPREITAAQCDKNAYPTEPSVCGWKQINGSQDKVEIGTIAGGTCAEAEIKEETTNCGNQNPLSSCNVETLKIDSCPLVKLKSEKLADLGEIKGLPLGATREFKRELVRGERVKPKTVCAQERSLDGQLECGTLKNKILVSTPQLMRKDRSWRPIALANFENISEEPVCGTISPEQVRVANYPREEVLITGVPFDDTISPEVSRKKPILVNGKIKCSTDYTQALTLEERLREHAALNGFVEARDPSIEFEYEARPLGTTKLYSSTRGCQTKEFATPDGCSLLRASAVGSEACGSEVNLGSLETEPRICKEPGVVCRREFAGMNPFSSAPNLAQEGLEMATQLGANVLQKYLPQSTSNCGLPNCTNVKLSINPDKTVSATVNYFMPLSWPLDELLGKKSIGLSRLRTERIEAM